MINDATLEKIRREQGEEAFNAFRTLMSFHDALGDKKNRKDDLVLVFRHKDENVTNAPALVFNPYELLGIMKQG